MLVCRVSQAENCTLALMVKPPHKLPLGPVLLRASILPAPSLMSMADLDRVATGCENLHAVLQTGYRMVQSYGMKWRGCVVLCHKIP